MTRNEIYFHTLRIAKQTVPGIDVDPRSVLYDMSVAEQEVEDRTGRVVRKATITLDKTSTTGNYNLPADLRAIESVTYAPVGAKGYWPVEVYAPEAFDRIRQLGILDPGVNPLPPPGGTMYALRDMTAPDVLTVYPTGIEGVLTVRYKPELAVYSPTSPLWSDYGDTPEAAMETHGLDESMEGITAGIIRYCAAMLLRGTPGGLQLYGADISLLLQEWERALNKFAKRTVTPGLETTPSIRRPMGGVA